MKKKVCHLSYNHDAFDDRIYWKELITLKEAGYDVTHICVGEEEKDFISNEGVKILQVKRIKSKRNIWIRRLLHFFYTRNETINSILHHALLLKADVYHYHDLQLNTIVNDLKKNLPNARLIYDCHEAYHLLLLHEVKGKFKTYFKRIVVFFINQWELKAAKKCDHILANYEYVQQYFRKKISNIPITIIYNYNFFNSKEIECSALDDKYYDFIYAGYLSKARGIIEVIIAFSIFIKCKSDSKLLLIGQFENEEFFEEARILIENLGLKYSITIHPSVPFSEIKKFYKISKIGLCTWHETLIFKNALPIKLFEYMSFGIPVIFSNHGPSIEIINESKCGILVNEKNEKCISLAMESLIFDKKLYNFYSQNAINSVKSKYNWDKEKIKLLKIYSN